MIDRIGADVKLLENENHRNAGTPTGRIFLMKNGVMPMNASSSNVSTVQPWRKSFLDVRRHTTPVQKKKRFPSVMHHLWPAAIRQRCRQPGRKISSRLDGRNRHAKNYAPLIPSGSSEPRIGVLPQANWKVRLSGAMRNRARSLFGLTRKFYFGGLGTR